MVTSKSIFTQLLIAILSMNFAKCIYATSHQEFLGMAVDSTRVRSSPFKVEAITNMPRPTNVEELRSFLGMTGYLRQYVGTRSIVAAPLANILHNKTVTSRRARKSPMEWGGQIKTRRSFVSRRHCRHLYDTRVPIVRSPVDLADTCGYSAAAPLSTNCGSSKTHASLHDL